MRIGVMAWGGASWLGGWNYYLNMARVLRAHSEEASLQLFVPSDVPDEMKQEAATVTGNPVAVLPRQSRVKDVAGLAGFWDGEFARRLRARRVDVVLEQASFLGRNFPIPVVPWIADLQHRAYPQYFSRSQRLTRDIGFSAQVLFRRHAYVSSNSALKDLLGLTPAPRAKVHVIPFAVRPTVQVSPERISQVKKAYELEGPYLFLPNQLWRHKNHTLALHAMAILARRGNSVRLVLCGRREDPRDPAYGAELSELTDRLALANSLVWLGTVPYADLLCLTAGAVALVNPSLFEGWSTTVEEAKSLGVPMALSDIEVHREQAGGKAEFFDPYEPATLADAIERIQARQPRDVHAALEVAAAANLVDQQAYTAKLLALFNAAVADGPGA